MSSYKPRLSIIEDRVSAIADELGINDDIAFMRLGLSVLLDQEEVAEEDIVDGGQDKQIDVIVIEDDSDSQTAIINIFQFKNTRSFSSNALIQLGNGLDWMLEQPLSSFTTIENRKFVNKIKEFRGFRNDYGASNISINVFFVTTGDSNDIASEFDSEYIHLKEKYENAGYRSFSLEVVGAIELVDFLRKREMSDKIISEKIRINYDTNKPSILEAPSTENLQGVIVTVQARELARIINMDEDGLIFDRNIRQYLGKNGKINMGILETCSSPETSGYFWFLNNGVTMVCDEFNVTRDPDNPFVKVHNLQIVNGCQTSETLKHAFNEKKLEENTSVVVKIFSTKEPILIDKITVSTNSQNSINNRDLKANHQVQIDLQRAFYEKFSLYYERKKNEFKRKSIDKLKIVKNEKVAQAFLAFGRKKPSLAKDKVSRIFSEEKIYNEIFTNPDVIQLVFCYKLLEYVEKEKNVSLSKFVQEKDGNMFDIVSYGSLHIVRIMGALVLGQDKFLDNKQMLNVIDKFNVEEDSYLESCYERTLDILAGIFQTQQQNYSSPPNVFKNSNFQSEINKEIEKMFPVKKKGKLQ